MVSRRSAQRVRGSFARQHRGCGVDGRRDRARGRAPRSRQQRVAVVGEPAELGEHVVGRGERHPEVGPHERRRLAVGQAGPPAPPAVRGARGTPGTPGSAPGRAGRRRAVRRRRPARNPRPRSPPGSPRPGEGPHEVAGARRRTDAVPSGGARPGERSGRPAHDDVTAADAVLPPRPASRARTDMGSAPHVGPRCRCPKLESSSGPALSTPHWRRTRRAFRSTRVARGAPVRRGGSDGRAFAGLHPPQRGVQAAAGDELVVGARLDDAARPPSRGCGARGGSSRADGR